MKSSFAYHPLEVSFCGYSNSGKTTLVCTLIEKLSSRFNIGYVKSDAHRFEMDKKGKDTWVATQSGARKVWINDPNKENLAINYRVDSLWSPYLFLTEDFVFIEGYKKEKLPKFIFLDDEGKILDEADHSKILGFIVKTEKQKKMIPKELQDIPCLNRDNVSEILKILEKHLTDKSQRTLKGLVLVGGKSKRMGQDKLALEYEEGRPQYKKAYALLENVCSEVFISSREEQKQLFEKEGLKVLTDSFLDLGPTSGILSALKSDQNADWLVLACDLPLVDLATVQHLSSHHDPFKMATAYHNEQASRLEPLCTIYTPKAYPLMLKMVGLSRQCPQKLLWNSPVKRVPLKQKDFLANANTPDDYIFLKQKLKNKETATGDK